MKLIFFAFLAILPSRLKCLILRLLGHEIGRDVYIGMSLMMVGHIVFKDNVYIGHGNVFRNLSYLKLGNGSRINRWNYFTSGSYSTGRLEMGERSSISMRHYFDICDTVTVGSDTIVAGIRSTIYTHSKGLTEIDYTKPITIGDWCYIGSNVCLVPGVSIGSHCFVGMGAVIAGDYSGEEYVLLAGNPAKVKKRLDDGCEYYKQKQIHHEHMVK